MDFLTSKAMIVAASIFATVAITSSVIIMLGYVLDIYGNVAKLDYQSLVPSEKYAKYNNVTMSGIEVYNMIKKIEDENAYNNANYISNSVSIIYQSGANESDIKNKKNSALSHNYYVTTNIDNNGNVTSITVKLP